VHEVLILLGVSVAAVAVFSRFHLPPIVGYLFVGFITGPHALGLVHPGEVTHLLGEIGVAFLLFTIGLEFSLSQLRAMKSVLLGLGGTQVAVGTVSGALISWALGIEWAGAFIVGGALSLSSTAIVVRQLADQLELQSRHGRLSLGVLLFQDLAAVPFLVVIPILAAQTGQSLVWPLILALIKGTVAFPIMLMLGHWALRPLFHVVTASRAPDLLTLTILLVSLAAAWITSVLGLSLALGAFLAGIMLGETEYRHQIETDIRPFRDVLLSLFFVTVGMRLDSALLAPVWPWIALILSGVIIGKGLAVALLTHAAGYDRSTALRTGLVLGQGGEFGIALLTLAVGTGLIAAE
jgi:monovalent cation:H+ antiporter-2, CPA2 family